MTAEAANVYGTIHTNDGDGAGESVVVPFRSYYVPYISKNASETSKMIQYIWCKLFTEELNYGPGQTYYTNVGEYKNGWSFKYYGDYVSQDGVKSSKGVQVTYNDDFDGFLYQTIMANPDFIINFIIVNTNQGNVFHNYAMNAKNHKYLADALIDLTADSKYLGGGKDASDNVFLKGSSSVGYKYGATPAWSDGSTTKNTHDIDVLRLFGVRYSRLNDKQKQWVRTYMNWMVDDYVRNGSSAVAAYSNSPSLYELIATSYDGFISGKAQEFFNYCINTNTVNVGDLIYNTAMAYGMDNTAWFPTGEADIRANTNMSMIFAGDADCDYGNGYGQAQEGIGSGSGDGDYDWLAYNIAFNTNEFYTRLRNLVNGYPETKQQLDDWKNRRTVIKPGPIITPIKPWIENEGKSVTEKTELINYHIHSGRDSNQHDCGAQYPGGNYSNTKPVGVEKISISMYPFGSWEEHGGTWVHAQDGGTGGNIKITDISNGNVIYNSSYKTGQGTIDIDLSNYTGSSTIKIEVTDTYFGYGGTNHNGPVNFNCNIVGGVNVTYTYANLDACLKSNHSMRWDFEYYDIDGKRIADTDHYTIPYSAIARGECTRACGHTVVQKSISVTKIENASTYAKYKAQFGGGIGSRTVTVYKDANTQTSYNVIFSPASYSQYLSTSGDLGKTGHGKFVAQKSESWTYNGEGLANVNAMVEGTVTLSSKAIKNGAKEITVRANSGKTTYKLMSPKYGILPGGKQTVLGNTSTIWDLSRYTDEQLEDIYIIVELYTKSNIGGGMNIGETATAIARAEFFDITVQY